MVRLCSVCRGVARVRDDRQVAQLLITESRSVERVGGNSRRSGFRVAQNDVVVAPDGCIRPTTSTSSIVAAMPLSAALACESAELAQ